MPNLEPVVIDGHKYTIRHVGPRAAVFPTSPAANRAVLARSDMVARPLPMSADVSSSDFVSGSWTGRLGDAGEATFVFPNAIASDGVPWRQRFDGTGHLQFIELYDNELLDFCGVIDTVQVDEQQVQVHCQDGWFLLKKAYERDLTVVQAPRDVIERGTQVWVPTTTDNFPAGALNAQWTPSTTGTASVSVGAGGGLVFTLGAVGGAAQVDSSAVAVGASGTWRAICTFSLQTNDPQFGLELDIFESTGDRYVAAFFNGLATLGLGGGPLAQVQYPTAASYTLVLESDGEWIWGFVNGLLIGCIRRGHATTTSLHVRSYASSSGLGSAASIATLPGVLVESLQPFLMRGSDKGDYVLPGVAATYPNGGLHARYYNDTDLQSDPNRLLKILNPTRSIAYAGTGPSEYQNQQDPTINGQANPTPGAALNNWSAKWFGAIYLKLSAGDYGFELKCPAGGNTAFRVWVGKTQFGDVLSDHFTWSVWDQLFTVAAASLKGSPSYGGTPVARDGWYPIIIEYAVDGTVLAAPQLLLRTSPAAYTDPGGTAIASGAQTTVVPATSLSPLGCVDQRYQGVSHFDLAQQTVQAFGHQASVEPQQLESVTFPGVLAPRLREGHDTDIILKPDLTIREDGEGILNYSSTEDATDTAGSLQGNGAGFNNGTAGQLQELVYDPPTLLASLFDLQGWQDFSDASFTSLLKALLNTQLGLKLAPWQLLSADPTGDPRLTYTWPLPGTLAAMRWRPGDGLRVQARDINVIDTSPRQQLVITRNITPNGKTGATATFANRPRNEARALKQQLFSATRQQRNYQRQLVTLTGTYISGTYAAGNDGDNSLTAPLATDKIVRARLRVTLNNNSQPFSIKVNGVDQTSTLCGAATIQGPGPFNVDIMPVAAPDANGRLYVQLHNGTVASQSYQYQLLVDVLR